MLCTYVAVAVMPIASSRLSGAATPIIGQVYLLAWQKPFQAHPRARAHPRCCRHAGQREHHDEYLGSARHTAVTTPTSASTV